MIANTIEYERAHEELRYLETWLARLEQENPLPEKGLTRAGIRKMMARLHKELAVYEGNQPHPADEG
jgi:hypothetical protein